MAPAIVCKQENHNEKTRANPHSPGPSSSFLGSSNPLQKIIFPLLPMLNENDSLPHLNETNFTRFCCKKIPLFKTFEQQDLIDCRFSKTLGLYLDIYHNLPTISSLNRKLI